MSYGVYMHILPYTVHPAVDYSHKSQLLLKDYTTAII